MRLDSYLADTGLAPSRTRAAKLIVAGAVAVNGTIVTKASADITETDEVTIVGAQQKYVSRGGDKLEAALTAFSVDVRGKNVLDVGASTGGFTDCLLQAGAAHVVAVDAGQGQLDASLRAHPRVTSMEQCNARYLKPEDLPCACTMAVMDVSFISQTLLYPMLASVLAPRGILVSLIKPQFEAGRAALNRHGVVSDPKLRLAAVDKVCAIAADFGFRLVGRMQSPVVGGSGNIEYLACFSIGDNE